MKSAPQVVEQYNKTVAGNPKVTMVHISRDRSDGAAEEWAKEAGMPWFIILPDDVEDSELMEYRPTNGVPYYTMLDGEGNVVVKGSSGVFKKAAELAGS